MTFTVNNRFVTEPYVKQGLTKTIQNNIAIPGQREGLKGLTVLIGTTLSDGTHVPAGSTIYIKEETLHVHQFATKVHTCDFLPGKFMIVDLQFVEFIKTPENVA